MKVVNNLVSENISIIKNINIGTLIQLTAYGASDTYLCGNIGYDPQCYNVRDSIMNWFINKENGLPDKEDIEYNEIFTHYPNYLKPNNNILKSFDVKKEKAAMKIQNAWKTSISNPKYMICRNRLLYEFNNF